MRIAFGLLCCSVLAVPVALADEYITGNESPYPANPQRYDRFYSGLDKAFIGAGLDFSGVAGGGPWATMISSQYFITAYHWPANNSPSLTFYEGNSTSAGAHAYYVDRGFHYELDYNGHPADVYIGRLATAIPAGDHIASYPVLELPPTNNYAAYAGMSIYNYGRPNRVGSNVISKVEPYAEAGEDGPGMFFNYDVPGVGLDETYLMPGDSGGPSFAVVGGRLALLGEHFSNYGTSGQVPYDAGGPKASDGSYWSVDGFLPYYVGQINAILPLDQQIAVITVTPCDANLDGSVNINDLSVVLSNYDKTGLGWANGDFDGDGRVDIGDLSNILSNYDKTAGASSAGIKVVPEPSSLLLVGIGAAFPVWRRRRFRKGPTSCHRVSRLPSS
jgi:hypothetical protein